MHDRRQRHRLLHAGAAVRCVAIAIRDLPMNYKRWHEHQRLSLGVSDEQLDRLLEVAKGVNVATGGHVGYDELKVAITSITSLSASRLAEIALEEIMT